MAATKTGSRFDRPGVLRELIRQLQQTSGKGQSLTADAFLMGRSSGLRVAIVALCTEREAKALARGGLDELALVLEERRGRRAGRSFERIRRAVLLAPRARR